MKAILEFNLPVEKSEFDMAYNGSGFASAVWDLEQWLRNEEKYQNRDTITIEEVREKIRGFLSNNNLTLEMTL